MTTSSKALRVIIASALMQERDRLNAEGSMMKARDPARTELQQRVDCLDGFLTILGEDGPCRLTIERDVDDIARIAL